LYNDLYKYKGENEFDKVFFKATGGKEVATFEQFIDFIKTLEEDKTTPEQVPFS